MDRPFDTAVIGAGWAGLGVSYMLTKAGLTHRVLERGRIGETWLTQRWDSFHLNTVKFHTVMPGDHYEGSDPEGFYTHDEFVALLEDYARRYGLPVATNTPVTALTREGQAGVYRLITPVGELTARAVVIASGSLNCARRPEVARALPPGLLQIDSSVYRNPQALPMGAVLVVGSAQSGGQIAEDLAMAGRVVFLSTGRTGRKPRRYRGRDIGFWERESGLFDIPRKDFVGPNGRIAGRPLLGALHTISLQSLSAQGVVLLGRFTGVANGRLTFADDVRDNVRFGDEVAAKTRRHIDDYIARSCLDAPPAIDDPAETIAPRLPNPPILSLDPREHHITTVIWCTGLEGDYSFVQVPGVLNAHGQPLENEGLTEAPGIYFAAVDFSSTRKSGTIFGIAEEAQRLVDYIIARRGNILSSVEMATPLHETMAMAAVGQSSCELR
ncbi:flavin-containing monooxygenase [Bradyrhizobium quebecense]|uniref:NAD(P)-binding domain-containing protein n=2 Tax=Bradyrhizobium quebecense TaxID=2748629 RepID=A0ABS3MAS0_9BRAD|nr:NAD(P)/FAD-dependent oxidoreductase [Bradyrhizobium quebecense]UGY03917.1 NAD(P)/FAD-dependent oxidoreductase [Bradyrhizobium quebecense]